MQVLVVGATGATGRLVVQQLLERGHSVKVIARSTDNLPENDRLNIKLATILDLSASEMAEYIKDCDAAISCLGHNLNFKGMFGKPRRLVKDSVKLIYDAIVLNQKEEKFKIILMNTTGNKNRDLNEKRTFAEQLIIGLLRVILPPQADNEQAADFLRTQLTQNDKYAEWVAVRPDGLINEENVTEYEVHPSPIRSAIFDSGKTSRVNTAHFMAELAVNQQLWEKWKGQMPVVYNKEQPVSK